jgi:hypothetical protein
MLIYHPAFDLSHGMFRLLRMLEVNPNKRLKWDTYRILDFYYLFPHLLINARLPRALLKRKNSYKKAGSKYNRIPAPRTLILQLRGSHELIVRSLIAKGFLDPADFAQGLLSRTARRTPATLENLFPAAEDFALVELLAVDVAAIPLTGADGLKERTGLLEHRYDAA